MDFNEAQLTDFLSEAMGTISGGVSVDSAYKSFEDNISSKFQVDNQTDISKTAKQLVPNAKLQGAVKLCNCDTSAVDAQLKKLLTDLESGVYAKLPEGKLKQLVKQATAAQSPEDIKAMKEKAEAELAELLAAMDTFIALLQTLTDPTKLIEALIKLVTAGISDAQMKKIQMVTFYGQLAVALVNKGQSLQQCYMGKYMNSLGDLQSQLSDAPADMQGILGAQIAERVEEIKNLLT